MSQIQVRCFGVGGGGAEARLSHSAYLYTAGDASVLIDCGEPVCASYKASGLSWDAVDAIFLSHLHSDHFGGLFMLLQGFWLENRRKPLRVHLPAEGVSAVHQMLQAAYLYSELLPFRLALEPLEARRTLAAGKLRVTPFRTTHLDGLRKTYQETHPGRYDAFCFLLETAHARIGHSADLGSPKDLDPLLAEPLDLLVCELDHIPAEELFLHLKGCEIRHLAFVHLGRGCRDNLEEVRRLAARALPGIPISFPADREMLEI